MGIGKSRVARSISEAGRHRGAVVLWGAGQEDLSLPYLPITTALRRSRRTAASRRCRAPRRRRHRQGAEEDPAHLWRRAEKALLDVLGDKPVVLVIDDLQWADPASQSLLLHLLVLLDHASAGASHPGADRPHGSYPCRRRTRRPHRRSPRARAEHHHPDAGGPLATRAAGAARTRRASAPDGRAGRARRRILRRQPAARRGGTAQRPRREEPPRRGRQPRAGTRAPGRRPSHLRPRGVGTHRGRVPRVPHAAHDGCAARRAARCG